MPARINALVAPLNEDQLSWRPAPNEWSIKEVLCHLRDLAEVNRERVHRLLTEDNPALVAVDQDELAAQRRYQEEISPTILPRYVEHRGAVIEALLAAPPQAYQRPGTHPEFGATTVQDIIERVVAHEREHWDQLQRLKAGVGNVKRNT